MGKGECGNFKFWVLSFEFSIKNSFNSKLNLQNSLRPPIIITFSLVTNHYNSPHQKRSRDILELFPSPGIFHLQWIYWIYSVQSPHATEPTMLV